jgi:hypothetical protein
MDELSIVSQKFVQKFRGYESKKGNCILFEQRDGSDHGGYSTKYRSRGISGCNGSETKGGRRIILILLINVPFPVQMSELSHKLKLSQPAVSLSVKRGEKITKENRYSLLDDTNL